MPDKRKHRGAHPADGELFSSNRLPLLREAVSDLSWLLTRGYSLNSSLKLAGDRYNLNERQRSSLQKSACSDKQMEERTKKLVEPARISDENLLIDGFNLIITLEAALSGGVLLACRDSCIRDLASVHGSYRSVEETEDAIRLTGRFLAAKKPRSVKWLLDRPISNSGRLAHKITDIAVENDWPWTVELVNSPDYVLSMSNDIVVTSDSVILDKASRWLNLGNHIVRMYLSDAWIVDLGDKNG